jgi:hypothetical protein
MENQVKDFDFFEYHSQISRDNILISYKGPLTDVLLSEFSRDIRRKLKENPRSGKKVFSIFMELAQNVLFYSKEINHFGNHDRVGTLVVLDEGTHYKVITGNLIYKKDMMRLIEKCETIKTLDRDALREYKRKLRNEEENEESKGAGIGLVQAALTSDNNLEAKMKEMGTEFAFFIVLVSVDK